jgi:NAD(P)H-dependent FMN reductase
MPRPKILVFSGSVRTGSFNARLAALAVKEFLIADADVTRLSLLDYPMPLYDGDLEARSGPPETALKLKRLMMLHRGVFITSPEYNASIAPLLKNTLDWVSRVREEGEQPLGAYRNRVFALGAASNGTYGGMRSLIALRQVLELGCGAMVLPEQVVVREAAKAFDDNDDLVDHRTTALLKSVVRHLIDMTRQMA